MSIFSNPFKFVADTISAPFNTVGKVLKGKGNLGDFLNLGMTASSLFTGAPIGQWNTTDFLNFAGVKDPTKMNTTDFLSALQGGQGMKIDQKQLKGYADMLSALSLNEQMRTFPLQARARDRAYNALSEEGARGSIMAALNLIQNQAKSQGLQTANSLGAKGYGSGVADAAILDAQNRGNEQSANLISTQMSPSAQANRAIQQSTVYGGQDPLSTMLALQGSANNQRIADAQYNASRPPSFFESILGVGSQVLPYVLADKQKKPQSGINQQQLGGILSGLQRWGS